jgi:3-oxoacyl-[acyl-carrier protein] reductase
MGTFDNVSVLVTGGTRGIGRGIVAAFASRGARVTFTGTNEDAAAKTIAATGAAELCRFERADVSDADGAKAVVKAAVEHGEGLDVVVNNAGITRDNLLMRMKDDEWKDVIDVNLSGTFYVTRAAFRPLMKSKRGRVINITSVVGLRGNAGQANYAASKGGIVAFTKAVAQEMAGRGVTANAVAPGFIQTDMTAALDESVVRKLEENIPLRRLGTVEDVTEVVAFLASKEAGYVTGQVIPVDGGMVM